MTVEPEVAPPLSQAFYDRPVLTVAQDLVGCVVAHGDTSGVIVETEAYHESEAACHAYVGVTRRTATLFGPPGVAYVYRSYGIHAMLNAVCEAEGVGAAVLIRALERDKVLSELTPVELAEISPLLDEEFHRLLRSGAWLESKVSEGGTSLTRVREQLGRARAELA